MQHLHELCVLHVRKHSEYKPAFTQLFIQNFYSRVFADQHVPHFIPKCLISMQRALSTDSTSKVQFGIILSVWVSLITPTIGISLKSTPPQSITSHRHFFIISAVRPSVLQTTNAQTTSTAHQLPGLAPWSPLHPVSENVWGVKPLTLPMEPGLGKFYTSVHL